MKTTKEYRHSHPNLSITTTGGENLGRCYSSRFYEIRSLRPLAGEQIRKLREAGVLGFGQVFEFVLLDSNGKSSSVQETMHWSETAKVPPTGTFSVTPVEIDNSTGEVVASPSINPYTNLPDKDITVPFYVYKVVDYVDSSD